MKHKRVKADNVLLKLIPKKKPKGFCEDCGGDAEFCEKMKRWIGVHMIGFGYTVYGDFEDIDSYYYPDPNE